MKTSVLVLYVPVQGGFDLVREVREGFSADEML